MSGSQLDRERQPVDRPADRDDVVEVPVDVEAGIHGVCGLLEQRDRIRHASPDSSGVQREREHVVHLLAGHPQPGTRGRQHAQLRAALHEPRHDLGRLEHVLGVVEDEQQAAVAQRLGERLDTTSPSTWIPSSRAISPGTSPASPTLVRST